MATDQEYYASRIREVVDGHWLLGDIYYSDNKDAPFVQPPLPEWVQARIGLGFGLGIGGTVVLCKFLFGFLLFLSMALFCARLFGRPWLAILATSSVLFSWFLFASPWVFLSAIEGNPVGVSVARFSRLTNPQFTSTLFFFALWTFVGWLQAGKRRSLIISGILTGLTFYAYVYAWTYLLSAFGLFFVWMLIRREWSKVRDLFLLFGMTLLVALPYSIYLLTEIIPHPAYPDLAARIGMLLSHAPLWGTWAAISIVIALAFGKTLTPYPAFLSSLALAGIVVLNQQILTGKPIVPHHYHWYYIHPFAIVLVVMLGGVLLTRLIRSRGVQTLLWSLALCVIVFWGITFQADAYQAQRVAWGVRQNQAGLLFFFNDPAYRDLTLYAPDDLHDLITVYTPMNVTYAVNTSNCCLTPTSRLRDAYFLDLWIEGLDPAEAASQFLGPRREDVSRRIYGIYYRELTGSYDGTPDDVLREEADRYGEYVRLSLCAKFSRQPLDFVAWPVSRRITEALQKVIGGAELIYADSAYRVWDVRSVCSR